MPYMFARLLAKKRCPFEGSKKRERLVRVGWLVDTPSAGLIYMAPKRVHTPTQPPHPKSASRCPAVVAMEGRYFEIGCPFDIHLKLVRDKEGNWGLQNILGDAGSIRSNKLNQIVHMVNPKEWRNPNRPMLQVSAPYRIICDELLYLTQCSPFFDYQSHAWPGVLFGGRFRADVWPRSLMWAFEWHDTNKDLKIKRGDPWFYLYMECYDPERSIKLVEAEMTSELRTFCSQIDGVTNYVNQTFSLFKAATKRRPKTLLVERSSCYEGEKSYE